MTYSRHKNIDRINFDNIENFCLANGDAEPLELILFLSEQWQNFARGAWAHGARWNDI